HRLHVLRQLHGRNVQRHADFGPFEVDGDEVGDGIGRAIELDLVAHHVEHAAALDAGRLLFIDEADRYVDVDEGVLADAQEVDMHREIPDRIELVVLGQNLDLLAVDIDRGDRGQEGATVDLVVDVLIGQGDRQGRLLVAIDDCGYFTVATNCTGGPLTDLFACFGLELIRRCLAHGISFQGYLERFRAVNRSRKRRKPPRFGMTDHAHERSCTGATFPRIASKGVYAGGGSITE